MLRRTLLFTTLTTAAAAQGEWAPTRPVRLLVAFAPGGSADALARRLAELLAPRLGQPVVVENRPGAGGNLAFEALANAVPDGHTLALGAAGPHAINPALFGARMPYDAARAFAPIIQIQDQPNILVAHPSVPSERDAFLAWLRARPNEPYGSPGVGTGNHLTGVLLSQAAGVALEHVPYRGSGPGLADVVGGQVKLFIDNISTSAPLVREGRLRGIAVSTPERARILPDVPSFAELGLAAVRVSSWQGLFAPAGLPAPVLARLNAEVAAALREPALVGWLEAGGAVPIGGSADAFARFVAGERERWAEVIRMAGIKPE